MKTIYEVCALLCCAILVGQVVYYPEKSVDFMFTAQCFFLIMARLESIDKKN